MLLAGVPVQAQSVADFYRGKQIRVIVGSSRRRLRHLGAARRPPHAPFTSP